MYLEDLFPDVGLEDSGLECKITLNREDSLSWLKTVAGFANASGGDLFIGVEDRTNKLIGFTRSGADEERNYFNNRVNEHLTPRPPMKTTFLRYRIHEEERFIIHVTVEESSVKPVVLKYKGVPSIYMRREGFTNGATYEEIIEMSTRSRTVQYDVLPSEQPFDPADFKVLKSFYAARNNGRELSEKALRSLGFMDGNGLLANGALLFRDDCSDTKTRVQCSVFTGFNRGSERIVTINRFTGNLIDSIQYMLDFVRQHMNQSILKTADGRKNLDAFPARALFEGIVNAVAHRDYYLDGTQIQVDLFRDRLEISSPGGFYRGEKLGKTFDLSGIISKRRNELITGVLVACNVMEAAGTGFDKIAEEYAGADSSHRPYIYSGSDHFTLVLPDLTYQPGVAEDNLPVIRFVPVPNGTAHDEKVLSFCYGKARRAAEIAEHLGLSDSAYLRKQVLGNLESNGYLEKSKVSRASYYKTSRELVELV